MVIISARCARVELCVDFGALNARGSLARPLRPAGTDCARRNAPRGEYEGSALLWLTISGRLTISARPGNPRTSLRGKSANAQIQTTAIKVFNEYLKGKDAVEKKRKVLGKEKKGPSFIGTSQLPFPDSPAFFRRLESRADLA